MSLDKDTLKIEAKLARLERETQPKQEVSVLTDKELSILASINEELEVLELTDPIGEPLAQGIQAQLEMANEFNAYAERYLCAKCGHHYMTKRRYMHLRPCVHCKGPMEKLSYE